MAGLISRFSRNRSGNFAMIFAFAFPALMASVALGVDIANSLTTKTELQDANDAAVLFAARYFKQNRKQPTLAAVQAFLDGNSNAKVTAKNLAFNKTKSEFTLESQTKVKTYLMGYFGKSSLDYSSLSKANLGFSETLEFALALDTTGSMAADGKMAGLKVAANDFIDVMFDAKDRGADIKGGIVPFAEYVNVGVSQKGQPWLSVPIDVDTRVTTNVCRMEAPIIGQTNCKSVYFPAQTIEHPDQPETCSTTDGNKSCTPATPAWTENRPAGNYNQCEDVFGPEQKVCSDQTTGESTQWKGCVGSRDYPLNLKDATYGKRIPGLNDVVCSVELQTLTDDRDTLKDKINSLSPRGDTYLPEGVMWGTRVLTEQAPFTESKIKGKGGRPVRKALVVMTDGMNTLSPNGAYHVRANLALADTYTSEACDEAKAQKLEVFTISFGNAVPSAVKDLLEACASDPTKFFHARTSADLKDAFEDIANEMLAVKLTQ
jgi:Flp pilus assembly protein TadG